MELLCTCTGVGSFPVITSFVWLSTMWFIRSLFGESGAMRAQSKAVLKTKLQAEQSSLIQGVPDDVIIDGFAMLWTVHWPANGAVEDDLINFMGTIKHHLERCDVYLII